MPAGPVPDTCMYDIHGPHKDTRQSHDSTHGTHKGRPDADKIPAKAMHGTHKGRLTPTIYPRIPWYSRMSMACTRVC
ncbi:hypothetical protein L210DRAFT_3586015 [Boletus edulis BED1]|uniref:Uncharacterized protein n=1 Tax=Boletus edulis BED1 TaxID=1328754 RepID=A0AAD4G689_BOLED|nr:hypothetical protein L210DRAFT_3586015 [Boletus edulis BED1]